VVLLMSLGRTQISQHVTSELWESKDRVYLRVVLF
jgi:hypothetical protein